MTTCTQPPAVSPVLRADLALPRLVFLILIQVCFLVLSPVFCFCARWIKDWGAGAAGGPPPSQVRWKHHTIGDCCIYCGTKSVTFWHFRECREYQKAAAANEAEDEEEAKKRGVFVDVTSPQPPDLETPSAGPCNKRNAAVDDSSVRLVPDCNTNTRVTPAHTNHPVPSKKTKVNQPSDNFIFSCLACGNRACPYDNGYTVLKQTDDQEGPEIEYDPSEPPVGADGSRCTVSFDEIKGPLRMVVGGILKSKGIWTVHKFLGNPQLDLKVKTWMRNRIEPETVDSNWPVLRQGVKETLHYKRQKSIHSIRAAFFGKSILLLLLSFQAVYSHLLLSSSTRIQGLYWLLSPTLTAV